MSTKIRVLLLAVLFVSAFIIVRNIVVKDVVAEVPVPAIAVIVTGGPNDSTDIVVTWAPDTLGHRLVLSVDGQPHLNNGILVADTLTTSYTFRVGPVPVNSSSSYVVGIQASDWSTGEVSDYTYVYIVRNGSTYLPPVAITSSVLTILFPTSAFSIADSYVVTVTEYDIMGNRLLTTPLTVIRSPADSLISLPGWTKGNRYQLNMQAYAGPIRSPIMSIGHIQFERQ